MKGLVGGIGRYALHDGPGIRTVVFFKGCQFRCPWCHNPEYIAPGPEVMFFARRCVACGECADVCPRGALPPGATGASIDRVLCDGCGVCVDACPSGALEMVGSRYLLEGLVETLVRDRLYYESSGGGVTISGGEPTLHLDDLAALLERLQGEGVHVTLQTNGDFPMGEFREKCLDHLSLIHLDLKLADGDEHRDATGVTNERIWANLEELAALRPGAVVPRIPLIPGYTATEDNLGRLARRLRALGLQDAVLLPYHPFGLSKAAGLGRVPDPTLPSVSMSADELEEWRACFAGRGVRVAAEGEGRMGDPVGSRAGG